jgi:hypothetical protein
MLEALGEIPYQECNGKYRRVRELIEGQAADAPKQNRIYDLLFKNGGRCDCTVDRNIVRAPNKLSSVEDEIKRIVQG